MGRTRRTTGEGGILAPRADREREREGEIGEALSLPGAGQRVLPGASKEALLHVLRVRTVCEDRDKHTGHARVTKPSWAKDGLVSTWRQSGRGVALPSVVQPIPKRITVTENHRRPGDLLFPDAVEPFIRTCPGPAPAVKALRLVAYQPIRGIPGLEPDDFAHSGPSKNHDGGEVVPDSHFERCRGRCLLYRRPSVQGGQAVRLLHLAGDPMGHLSAGVRPPRTRSESNTDRAPVGVLGRFVLEQIRQEPDREDAHSAPASAAERLGY